jgi:acetolactate synthase I/II/III large subunit
MAFDVWNMGDADMVTKTTAEVLVEGLVVNEIDTLFCLPGMQNDGFFDALHKSGAPHALHTRHEQGSAYMALGAAVATGKPQAYCVVPGPGFLNTTAALSTAYALNAPVLALVGQIPEGAIGKGFGLLHEIPDQLGIMERLTKSAAHITGAEDAAVKITDAFRQLRSDCPKPVALECAMTTWTTTAEFSGPLEKATAENRDIDLDSIAEAARILGAAKKPMICVGGGALGVSEAVRELAEMLQAPVISSRNGRGVLDSRHYLSHTMPAGHALWKDTDAVLAIGSRLQVQRQLWGTDDGLKIIHLDADNDTIERFTPCDVKIVAESAVGVPALIDKLQGVNAKRDSREDELTALQATFDKTFRDAVGPQMELLDAIRNELPEDGIFVEDLTQIGYVSRFAFPTYQPRTFLSSGYQGTLGWGFAGALGAKVAMPDRKIVSIAGDGGFMFNVQEMATAVQNKIAVTVIVLNDNAFGNVKRIQQEGYGGRTIASDLQNPNFVALAESFGALGLRAHTPAELGGALRTSFENDDGPTLIEVPCGEFPSPWGLIQLPRQRG